MHLFLSAEASEPFLLEELRRAWPDGKHVIPSAGWVQSDVPLESESGLAAGPPLAFCRQALLGATAESAVSISAWGERLMELVVAHLEEERPWQLHVEPHYGVEPAGRNRCQLIVESLREKLRRKHRRFLRSWQAEPGPFDANQTFVQLILTGPEAGFSSAARAPWPHRLRAIVSPFPKGEIPIASDKAAPSRAFAKLVEAEQRLGRRIERGQTCVDLGASPGSWTYVALQRGARVIAVDRSTLRDDLMRHPLLDFRTGDAFKFLPDQPVDWLLCDVIAAPERSIGLVFDWVRQRRTRHFVVTIKFKGQEDYPVLDSLKKELPSWCGDFFLTRLCANKNEVCAFGTVRA